MQLIHDDCLNWLKKQPDNSVHLFLQDPPYGINFMGRKWDNKTPSMNILKEIYRVLKHGGFLVSFSSPRTYHILAYQSEEVGFEVHPFISWIYSSGYPKAKDCEKNILKVTGDKKLSEKWHGVKYGKQSLKPSNEPIGIFQKPIETNNQIDNVIKHGTGTYNIDETRVEYRDERDKRNTLNAKFKDVHGIVGHFVNENKLNSFEAKNASDEKGRFPSNAILDDGSGKILDCQNSDDNDVSRFFKKCDYWKDDFDSFFYVQKASYKERNIGCDNLPEKVIKESGGARTYNDRCAICGKKFIGVGNICQCESPVTDSTIFQQKNNHVSLKPVSLMIYLLKTFVSPIDNFKVVDCFMGSGTTGMSSVLFDNVDFIGIEKEKDYYEIAQARCEFVKKYKLELKRNFDEKKCKIDFINMNIPSHQGNIGDFF